MIPSVFEKFSYGFAVVILVVQGRMHRPICCLAALTCCSASCS